MKKWLCLLGFMLGILIFNMSAAPSQAAASTYYVDATGGNDVNSGLSSQTAWKTLTKVNSVTFGAGDRILFKAGETWTGTLHPLGSGTASGSIVIDMYGTGNKPRLQGQGSTNVLMLYNQEYWDIGNLEITNYTPTQGTTARSGVEVIGEDFLVGSTTDITNPAVLHNIRLHDLYIHDVNGKHTKTTRGSAGINVVVRRNLNNTPYRVTKFDHVLIENNKIENVTRTGIMVNSEWNNRTQQGGAIVDPNIPWTPATNVEIRGNQVLHVSGDGIVPHVTTGAMVEYNKVDGFNEARVDYNAGMWTYNGDYTTYQYNEVSGGKTIKDGMAFDFDNGTKGLVFQYNYSHDNEGGTVLICQNENNGSVSDGIFRYNISQNDKYQMITVCGGSNYTNMQFYNNVFYVGSGIANNLLINNNGNAPAGSGQAIFKNNIFYNLGTGAYAAKSTWTYDSNLFYGNNAPTTSVIPDVKMIVADPQFVSPGSGTGINSLGGYQVKNSSPALNTGVSISGNGSKDYWGNSLYYSSPDRGAFELQSAQNAAFGLTASSGSYITNPAYATDGTSNNTNQYAGLDQGLQWMKLDLGAAYNVSSIKLWHFFGDARKYHDVIIQFSNTADFSSGVTTVFNNDTNNSAGQGTGSDAEYTESSTGKSITFAPIQARYVRLFSNGSTSNAFNHYVDVQVFGTK